MPLVTPITTAIAMSSLVSRTRCSAPPTRRRAASGARERGLSG